MEFRGMDPSTATDFCRLWLPAWSGSRPDRLIEFYTDDAFYADPACPQGLQGREAILPYFTRLLRRYPEWVWRHRRSVPAQDGFLNFWQASLSPATDSLHFEGVCLVQLRGGLIYRNEVFFDPAPLRETPRHD